MNHSQPTLRVQLWVIVAAILMAIVLCLVAWLIILGVKPENSRAAALPSLVFTIIPVATQTASPSVPTTLPTEVNENQVVDGISNGMYVQIQGTGGDGLRIRRAAGINSDPLFLGMESEVFQVRDGPEQADGYTWWYLVAPYDESRKGWAASKYLAVVAAPQEP